MNEAVKSQAVNEKEIPAINKAIDNVEWQNDHLRNLNGQLTNLLDRTLTRPKDKDPCPNIDPPVITESIPRLEEALSIHRRLLEELDTMLNRLETVL